MVFRYNGQVLTGPQHPDAYNSYPKFGYPSKFGHG